jgi:pimeloyl-ACP methyl ester carboxylesterase
MMTRSRVLGDRVAVCSSGSGPTIFLCHGNSSSSRCFQRQLESSLAQTFSLVAIDLPGHGQSARASHPDRDYTLPGYADALVCAAEELHAEAGIFVGWSLGGHVLLEALPRLAHAAGFLIFGAPPVASFAEYGRASLGNPAFQAAFQAQPTDDEALAFVSSCFRPGAQVPQTFPDDFHATDPSARSALGASAARNELRDEVSAAREMGRPLAILHGAHEQIISRAYLSELHIPTLWRGKIHDIADAGHAAHWENSDVFNRLLAEFAAEAMDVAPAGG